jgi:hypothetical protein
LREVARKTSPIVMDVPPGSRVKAMQLDAMLPTDEIGRIGFVGVDRTGASRLIWRR